MRGIVGESIERLDIPRQRDDESPECRRVLIGPLRAVERVGDDLHFGRFGQVAHVDDLAAPDDVEPVIAFRRRGDLGRRRGGRRRVLEHRRRAAGQHGQHDNPDRIPDEKRAAHA